MAPPFPPKGSGPDSSPQSPECVLAVGAAPRPIQTIRHTIRCAVTGSGQRWVGPVLALQFQIVGEILQVETFATGSAIREGPDCAELMGAVVGESARALLVSDLPMAHCILLKYIGMKLPESGARNSRSSIC